MKTAEYINSKTINIVKPKWNNRLLDKNIITSYRYNVLWKQIDIFTRVYFIRNNRKILTIIKINFFYWRWFLVNQKFCAMWLMYASDENIMANQIVIK